MCENCTTCDVVVVKINQLQTKKRRIKLITGLIQKAKIHDILLTYLLFDVDAKPNRY